MESQARKQTDDLIARFGQTPHAFDFFRAIRWIEAQARPAGRFARLGASLHPREDPVRFGQNPCLTFAPSTIEELQAGNGDTPAKIMVHFFGLFGPNGPLPLHLTEYARDALLHAKDKSMRDFCDIFHHRLLSLLYRAWAANQKTADFDHSVACAPPRQREEAWTGPRFAMYIGSFIGLGMESLRERDAVTDWAKLYYSGRLACQTRNAEGLGAIIQDYFGIPAQVLTFFGQWLQLPETSVCKIGETPETGALGVSTIVGSRVWDCQLKFRVRVGPMTLADLMRMLPTGDSFRKLKCWVLNYSGSEFYWDVQLVLKAAEVPVISLGQSGLLGWTTWLKSVRFTRDADDVVLDPELQYG